MAKIKLESKSKVYLVLKLFKYAEGFQPLLCMTHIILYANIHKDIF